MNHHSASNQRIDMGVKASQAASWAKTYGDSKKKDLVSIAEYPMGRLSVARDIAMTALSNIVAIKKGFEDGDAQAFASVIKSVLGDVHPLIEAGKTWALPLLKSIWMLLTRH